MQLKQIQPTIVRTISKVKSDIGTKLLVKCKSCLKSFDESYATCPFCGWVFGDPVPLQDITDVDMTDENGNWFQTYTIGSAKGDKYANERGGLYGCDLVRFTVDINNPEHLKLLELLDGLRDNNGCRYTLKLVG